MLVALEGCHERTSQVQRCTPSWLVRPRAVALVRYQLDVQYCILVLVLHSFGGVSGCLSVLKRATRVSRL